MDTILGIATGGHTRGQPTTIIHGQYTATGHTLIYGHTTDSEVQQDCGGAIQAIGGRRPQLNLYRLKRSWIGLNPINVG